MTAQRIEARVISLTGNEARRGTVARTLADAPFRWRFFDALSGSAECQLAADVERQARRFGRYLTLNEIGCFKSHVAVLRTFEDHPGLQWLLVLEDDVTFDTSCDLEAVLALLEERRIEYLRLFARRWKKADVVAQLGPRQLLRFRTDPYGTQAYLISRTGARRFLDSVSSIDMPIDDQFGRFWTHGLDIFALFPFPAMERSSASAISEGRQEAEVTRRRGAGRLLQRVKDRAAKGAANLAFRFIGRAVDGRHPV